MASSRSNMAATLTYDPEANEASMYRLITCTRFQARQDCARRHYISSPHAQKCQICFQLNIYITSELFRGVMAKDMMLYWGVGSPPCWRVMIALEEKNLQGYNNKQLSFEKEEHKTKEVTDLNPRAQLPTFKHGNIIVNESFAACMYLESAFKSQGTRLIPDNPTEQALVYQRMFETSNLQQKMYEVVFYEWLTPEGERHESALKRNKENLVAELKLWESYLEKMGKGSYLAGKNFSMVDVVCFPVVAFFPRFGCPKERCPRLMEYYDMVKDRPSIKASWPAEWLEKPEEQLNLKNL